MPNPGIYGFSLLEVCVSMVLLTTVSLSLLHSHWKILQEWRPIPQRYFALIAEQNLKELTRVVL